MPRTDLLVLTPDDLSTLTNRGTVKRAQKELEAGDVTCEIHEDDGGDLTFAWSDGIVCRFPRGKTIHDAVCTSGLAGISRHIVRSVLVYQREAGGRDAPADSATTGVEREDGESSAASSPPAIAAAWDPGSFSDDELVARFRRAAVTKARTRFDQGVLVELTRGAKPVARFLDEACTVRFLVPDDLRYVSADCAESQLPTWVPLAVWSFRQLPADQPVGLLCIQHADLPPPTKVLDALHLLLGELCHHGLSGLAGSWSARLSRTEKTLRDEGLAWPAELASDLLHQVAMYREHDARFEPQQVVHVMGELIARTRAITGGSKAVPQPLIRGTKSDRPTEIAGGRMIGVGLGVRPGKRHATLSAYLQDADSGSVVAVERTFADPAPDAGDLPRSFADLASTVVARGASLATLATSQLLLKSGKRTPSGVLVLPRATSSLSTNPQSFQWEQLKPPFAAEGFAQLAARFASLPPSYLRPRRRTEDLHVVAVQAAEGVTFDISRQRLSAVLRDARGETAQLVHPFHARGREGFNALLEVLEQRGGQVRFVGGHVRSNGRTLEIHPISVIVDDGDTRQVVQPWVSRGVVATNASEPVAEHTVAEESAVEQFFGQLRENLADLLLIGVAACDGQRWAELSEMGRQVGFVRLISPLANLAEAINRRANVRRWDAADAAVRHARELCLLSRIEADRHH